MTSTNTTIDTNDPAAVLNAAADLLERDGWIQGELWEGRVEGEEYAPGKQCCSAGALAVVTHPAKPHMGAVVTHPALVLLQQIIERKSISGWNDRQGQTAENVIATMRAAAQKAAAEKVVKNVVETMLRHQLDGTGD